MSGFRYIWPNSDFSGSEGLMNIDGDIIKGPLFPPEERAANLQRWRLGEHPPESKPSIRSQINSFLLRRSKSKDSVSAMGQDISIQDGDNEDRALLGPPKMYNDPAWAEDIPAPGKLSKPIYVPMDHNTPPNWPYPSYFHQVREARSAQPEYRNNPFPKRHKDTNQKATPREFKNSSWPQFIRQPRPWAQSSTQDDNCPWGQLPTNAQEEAEASLLFIEHSEQLHTQMVKERRDAARKQHLRDIKVKLEAQQSNANRPRCASICSSGCFTAQPSTLGPSTGGEESPSHENAPSPPYRPAATPSRRARRNTTSWLRGGAGSQEEQGYGYDSDVSTVDFSELSNNQETAISEPTLFKKGYISCLRGGAGSPKHISLPGAIWFFAGGRGPAPTFTEYHERRNVEVKKRNTARAEKLAAKQLKDDENARKKAKQQEEKELRDAFGLGEVLFGRGKKLKKWRKKYGKTAPAEDNRGGGNNFRGGDDGGPPPPPVSTPLGLPGEANDRSGGSHASSRPKSDHQSKAGSHAGSQAPPRSHGGSGNTGSQASKAKSNNQAGSKPKQGSQAGAGSNAGSRAPPASHNSGEKAGSQASKAKSNSQADGERAGSQTAGSNRLASHAGSTRPKSQVDRERPRSQAPKSRAGSGSHHPSQVNAEGAGSQRAGSASHHTHRSERDSQAGHQSNRGSQAPAQPVIRQDSHHSDVQTIAPDDSISNIGSSALRRRAAERAQSQANAIAGHTGSNAPPVLAPSNDRSHAGSQRREDNRASQASSKTDTAAEHGTRRGPQANDQPASPASSPHSHRPGSQHTGNNEPAPSRSQASHDSNRPASHHEDAPVPPPAPHNSSRYSNRASQTNQQQVADRISRAASWVGSQRGVTTQPPLPAGPPAPGSAARSRHSSHSSVADSHHTASTVHRSVGDGGGRHSTPPSSHGGSHSGSQAQSLSRASHASQVQPEVVAPASHHSNHAPSSTHQSRRSSRVPPIVVAPPQDPFHHGNPSSRASNAGSRAPSNHPTQYSRASQAASQRTASVTVVSRVQSSHAPSSAALPTALNASRRTAIQTPPPPPIVVVASRHIASPAPSAHPSHHSSNASAARASLAELAERISGARSSRTGTRSFHSAQNVLTGSSTMVPSQVPTVLPGSLAVYTYGIVGAR